MSNKLILQAAIACGAIGLFLSVVVISYKINRYINWNFSYGSEVEQTVKKMVKDECLK